MRSSRSREDFFQTGLKIAYFRDLSMNSSLSEYENKFKIIIESKNTTWVNTVKGRGSIGDV